MYKPRKYNDWFLWISVLALSGTCGSCAHSIFGKPGVLGDNGNASIRHLSDTVVKAVDSARFYVIDQVNRTRAELLEYLRAGTRRTTHDLSVGLLEGTIGYLDSATNRDNLALFIDSIITHTAGSARVQLIAFRDSLVSKTFIARTQSLLHGIVNELLVHPSEDLVNFALGDHVRRQLDSLLEMVVPAILNDRGIAQINKLRSTLVGAPMRKDIQELLDTALGTINKRLGGELGKNLKDSLNPSVDLVRQNAYLIIGVIALIVAALLVLSYLLHKKLNDKNAMLYNVTTEIEKLKGDDPGRYKTLTQNIQKTMRDKDLEIQMNQFLKEKGVS